MTPLRVLVTGGAGYIGSVVVEELLASGAQHVVILDDLSKGHGASVPSGVRLVRGDIGDGALVEQTCREEQLDSVVHMAAFALVGESVAQPEIYYRNNIAKGVGLLDGLRAGGVKRIVFSSTAAVYGEPARTPITEDFPTAPTNPYGETKLAFERALHWHARAHGFNHAVLRYFNAAGATQRCGEDHTPESHLIPNAIGAVRGENDGLRVFGGDWPTPDGTCVRDYIHVSDLARAHVLALGALESRGGLTYNLGCGGGYSVKQVIAAVADVAGKPVPHRIDPRRPGDPAILVASSERIRAELGWVPQRQDIRTIVADAWAWLEAHPKRYQG